MNDEERAEWMIGQTKVFSDVVKDWKMIKVYGIVYGGYWMQHVSTSKQEIEDWLMDDECVSCDSRTECKIVEFTTYACPVCGKPLVMERYEENRGKGARDAKFFRIPRVPGEEDGKMLEPFAIHDLWYVPERDNPENEDYEGYDTTHVVCSDSACSFEALKDCGALGYCWDIVECPANPMAEDYFEVE
jgi:predicted RNA-binding Zn-ribbon protein involved in translation (DUF1610 family)